MKNFVKLLFLFPVIINAQISGLDSALEELKQVPGIKIEEKENNHLRIIYPGGSERIFNTGSSASEDISLDTVPTFTFNLRRVNPNDHNHLYELWQEIPVIDMWPHPVIGDINKNEKAEIYGVKKDYNSWYSEVFCYEQNEEGIFEEVYKYPDNSLKAYNIYDIDRDGEDELHLILTYRDSLTYSVHQQSFFKKKNTDSLATEFYFNYDIYTNDGLNIQLDNWTFGDFNNDSITEAIYFGISPRILNLVKFNKNNLTFDLVFSEMIEDFEYLNGFTIGDFDLDGKTEIIGGGSDKNIYVLENINNDEYSITWKGNNGIENSYINFASDDINGNGKPEFWIGGQSFPNPITKITCYESDGNNSYKPIMKLAFPDFVTLSTLHGFYDDIDSDGLGEFIINIGNFVTVLEYDRFKKKFFVAYFNIFDNHVEDMTIYQIPNETNPSMILSMYESANSDTREFTRIYNYRKPSNVEETKDEPINSYMLKNAYPNPFNPETNVSFVLGESNQVKIQVFNLLGEEIATLLNTTLEKGEHTISWNGKDKNNLPVAGGIYLITMKSGSYRKTVKTLLLK